MKQGDTGADVRDLQDRLNRSGFKTEIDGWYGESTTAAVRAFQAARGLAADGIAGPRTLAVLRRGNASKYLKQTDLEAAADALGVPLAAVMAVSEVESAGLGFLPDGRPKILYERHVMYRMLQEAGRDADALAARYPNLVNPKRGGYAGGAAEHYRLTQASAIDPDLALQSASWGRYQIMGFHYAACGFAAAADYAAAMAASESRQLAAFVAFIEAAPALHKALAARKWTAFAKRYNGPAYKENLYDAKLASAYARHAAALEAAA